MLIGFECPNGSKVSFNYCINKCKNRCISIPTAIMLSHTRGWNGVPSATQLLKGTRETYLEIVYNYYRKPTDMTFAILGTAVHERLQTERERFISERRFWLDVGGYEVSGQIDVYDKETQTLWDYKTTSEYAVKLAMQGKKWEWNLQLNLYRLMLEDNDYPVKEIYIQYVSKNPKDLPSMGIIPIRMIDEKPLLKFYELQAEKLITSLQTGKLPPMCKKVFTWNGRKCKDYCPVRDICKKLKEANK